MVGYVKMISKYIHYISVDLSLIFQPRCSWCHARFVIGTKGRIVSGVIQCYRRKYTQAINEYHLIPCSTRFYPTPYATTMIGALTIKERQLYEDSAFPDQIINLCSSCLNLVFEDSVTSIYHLKCMNVSIVLCILITEGLRSREYAIRWMFISGFKLMSMIDCF